MPYYINCKDPSRRQRSLLLAQRLEEFDAARRELLLQLEELDARKGAVQFEFNELQNVDAPISSLPDEVLAMVFEAGVILDEFPKSRFAILVSHVTHRWRSIALATPRLWNTIFWNVEPDEDGRTPPTSVLVKFTKGINQAAMFLSRSASAPISIHIKGLYGKELWRKRDSIGLAHMIELLHANFYRCQHLSIQYGEAWAIEKIVEKVCCGPAPIISSIDFSHVLSGGYFAPTTVLFPYGTPLLKIAQLDLLHIFSTPHFLYAFQQLTSLRLTDLVLPNKNHGLIADALISMRVLDHLEVFSYHWITHDIPALVQPTIRFLFLHLYPSTSTHDAIQSFRAVSLTTLSIDLTGGLWYSLNWPPQPQASFPSLQHLILVYIKMEYLKFDGIAREFPAIARLTCQGVDPGFEVGRVLAAMSACVAEVSLHWTDLHTIAVSGPDAALDIPGPALDSQVAELYAAGIPIRTLMLPPALVAHVGGHAMESLRKLVEVEDFSLDWPTPFERFERLGED